MFTFFIIYHLYFIFLISDSTIWILSTTKNLNKKIYNSTLTLLLCVFIAWLWVCLITGVNQNVLTDLEIYKYFLPLWLSYGALAQIRLIKSCNKGSMESRYNNEYNDSYSEEEAFLYTFLFSIMGLISFTLCMIFETVSFFLKYNKVELPETEEKHEYWNKRYNK